MSKKLILLAILSLSVLFIFGFQKKDDFDAEKEAIIKVIKNETKHAYAQNLEELEKTWVHEPYAFRTYAHKDFLTEQVGWDSISVFFKSYIEKYPPIEDEPVQENFTIRIYGKGAWVIYEQYRKGQKEQNPDYIQERQFRVLEKTDEGWKIIFMGAINRNSYK